MTRDGETPREPHRYRRLPAGLHGLAAADVAQHQRSRLCAAMAELVAQRGYSAVRISDLTALAGVSRPTFYELFADKEACLLAAYDEIAEEAVQALAEAGSGASGGGELRTALETLAALAVQRPEQVSLLVLGSLGAGPAVRARREATLRALSRRMQRQRSARRRSGARSRGETGAGAGERMLVTMLIGGVREVAARRLRHGRTEELERLASPLAEWVACYRAAPPASLEPPTGAAERKSALEAAAAPRFPRTAAPGERLPSGRHDLSARYVARNQRERILDAVAASAAAEGYAGLAIPAIAKRAHVSHQTFYEHFPSKQDAFLAAMRTGASGLQEIGSEGFARATAWPESIAAGTHMLLRGLAAEPDYAHLATVDALAAGLEALDLREQSMRGLATLLERDGGSSAGASPALIAEAIVGGAWQAIHLEVAAGRARRLPLLAPMLIYFALVPYLGAKEAGRHARRRPPR
ncbi:MAG: TetR/AcrR family transcriptional regulator [Solirubrobacteraceae bacterium]